jgi:hypothetical protein
MAVETDLPGVRKYEHNAMNSGPKSRSRMPAPAFRFLCFFVRFFLTGRDRI